MTASGITANELAKYFILEDTVSHFASGHNVSLASSGLLGEVHLQLPARNLF